MESMGAWSWAVWWPWLIRACQWWLPSLHHSEYNILARWWGNPYRYHSLYPIHMGISYFVELKEFLKIPVFTLLWHRPPPCIRQSCVLQATLHRVVQAGSQTPTDSNAADDDMFSTHHGPHKVVPAPQHYDILHLLFAWLPHGIVKKTFDVMTGRSALWSTTRSDSLEIHSIWHYGWWRLWMQYGTIFSWYGWSGMANCTEKIMTNSEQLLLKQLEPKLSKFMSDWNVMPMMQKVLFYMPGLSSRS
jgi:hypothetical protein